MKMIKDRLREILITIPIVIFAIFSGYYLYNYYKSYNEAENSFRYIKYQEYLETLMSELGNEELLVSVFLGKRGDDSSLQKIKGQWRETDKAIEDLEDFISQNSIEKSKSIFNSLKLIKGKRSNIHKLNTSFIEMYLNDKISQTKKIIIEEIKSLDNILSENNDNFPLLDKYLIVTTLKESSYSEASLVSFFISRDRTIWGNELEFWEKEIGRDNLFSSFPPISKSKEYKEIAKRVLNIRISLLSQYSSGEFIIDLNEWDTLQREKITYLTDIQDTIMKKLKRDTKEDIDSSKKFMEIYIIVLLVSLILVIIVRNIFYNMAFDTRNLETILKNIEEKTDVDMHNNIEEIMTKDNKEVYAFIEKMIIDAEESKEIAQKANSAKSLFLANMSHEIRTPLNGIVGFTELLKTSNLTAEQEEFVQTIEKSSENLLSVINDILDFSKIESEKINVENIAFDPIVEFESGIESYGAKASEKNIDLSFYIDRHLAEYNTMGDPNRIKQILVNLISNAIKFTPIGGEIIISIKEVNASESTVTVDFSIKDSGIGITQKQQSTIFEAFSQADVSTTRKFGGTGLGLSISSKLVSLLGGTLELKSKEDEGTTFFFTLMMQKAPATHKIEFYNGINIGYLIPNRDKSKNINQNIKQYMNIFAKTTIINIEDLAKNFYDIIFVDDNSINQALIEVLKDIKSKIIILSTVDKKNRIKKLDIETLKVLYSPINFSKIKNSIALVKNTPKEKKEEVIEKFNNLKVIVADDNDINRKLIKITLAGIGVDATVVTNGKEAYDQRVTNEHNYDMIFMDIQMPILNGIEATHKIIEYEKNNNLNHIPIVALTANALKGDKEKFIAEGMDNYISKPIELNKLKSILNEYFSYNKTVKVVKKEIVKAKDIDILLWKHKDKDQKTFHSLLTKLNYSVEVINNFTEFERAIFNQNIRYALIDQTVIGLSTTDEIPSLLEISNIKSILFMENGYSPTPKDKIVYNATAPNIANIALLKILISKL